MQVKFWDIFCTVIDNFGDIGVCWRLARQLTEEHGLQVRLWVDDVDRLHLLCPEASATKDQQIVAGVMICRWTTQIAVDRVGMVVIEAFACNLPENYLAAMAASPVKPVWVNLEYLSAENWIAGCHGLASPHPNLPLVKHFFFPGFTSPSGGLMRETTLMQRRDGLRADRDAAWRTLNLSPPRAGEISISIFCYDNPALPGLLAGWIDSDMPIRCYVCDGERLAQVIAGSFTAKPPVGGIACQGNLSVHVLPFLSQPNYDHLLWLCDLNFVRGEDSFVRAQWAAVPFVWQIYPQSDGAHLLKLGAFLDRYCDTLSPQAATASADFWRSWNEGDARAATIWPSYWRNYPELCAHARKWCEQLCREPDLASELVQFCEKLL